MNNIKIGILIVMFSVAASGHAQGYQQPSADDLIKKMKEQINLTDQEASKVKPILESDIQQRQAIRDQAENQEIDQETMRTQLRELRNDTESQLSRYLSEEQMTQWKDYQRRLERLNGDQGSGSGSGWKGHGSGHHGHSNGGNY